MNSPTKGEISRRDLMKMIGLAAGAVSLPSQPAAAAHFTLVREHRVSLDNEGAMPELNGAIGRPFGGRRRHCARPDHKLLQNTRWLFD